VWKKRKRTSNAGARGMVRDRATAASRGGGGSPCEWTRKEEKVTPVRRGENSTAVRNAPEGGKESDLHSMGRELYLEQARSTKFNIHENGPSVKGCRGKSQP